MNGLAERHLQRVGRDNPVEGQRTGKTVVQIARGGLFLQNIYISHIVGLRNPLLTIIFISAFPGR